MWKEIKDDFSDMFAFGVCFLISVVIVSAALLVGMGLTALIVWFVSELVENI